MSRRLGYCLALGVLIGLIAGPGRLWAQGAQHVRVVLDISGSMKKNDENRLTILATLLFHDLVQPNTTLGDSFEVIPFDKAWSWAKPGDPPPVSQRQRLVAQFGEREAFVKALNQQEYDSKMTYFYPGVRAAIEDLRQTPGGAYDQRVIVLVTDGVPEGPTRDREAELIRDELVPQLTEHGIRLYILAFSEMASKNESFFKPMVKSAGGLSVGEYFVDPNGDKLLANMLEIFARSFGYSPDAAHQIPGVVNLDLEGNTKPERVAVVVLSDQPQSPPALDLKPPPGGAVHNPEGIKNAKEKSRVKDTGASYSLRWVLSPDEGDYGFDTDIVKGSVAVLRPTRLELQILPAPPLSQTERTMAETPFPLRVLVKSPIGKVGDPGAVKLSFRPLGARFKDQETGLWDYDWIGDIGAPANNQGTVTADGRVFDIVVELEADPESPNDPYGGYLEIEVRRGEAVVGSLLADHAHRIEVHPLLSIVPFPLGDLIANQALKRWQEACRPFQLELDAGAMPHADQPDYEYNLRAVLVPEDLLVQERELNEAFFTLDGELLEFEQAVDPSGAWYEGLKLTEPELLGEHEICVKIGKPTQGDPAQPVVVPLVFTLNETPYDDFRVVRPYDARIRIAPPTLLEKWGTWLLLLLALLSLLAALWYLRDRPNLPGDLCYSLGRDSSAGRLASHRLGEGSLLQRMLGLPVERSVTVEGEDFTLGWVRPIDEELYSLRAAKGARVEELSGDSVPLVRGRATIEVHRIYRIISDRGAYQFRMEYR